VLTQDCFMLDEILIFESLVRKKKSVNAVSIDLFYTSTHSIYNGILLNVFPFSHQLNILKNTLICLQSMIRM